MEKKIIKSETKDILKEFIDRSFKPNIVNFDFKNIFYKNLESLNHHLLQKDLKQLYTDKNIPEFTNKNCNLIFIQSDKDLILEKDSSNIFFEQLSCIFKKKPILIKLKNQGHCLTNFNLYEIIRHTFNK